MIKPFAQTHVFPSAVLITWLVPHVRPVVEQNRLPKNPVLLKPFAQVQDLSVVGSTIWLRPHVRPIRIQFRVVPELVYPAAQVHEVRDGAMT